MLLLSLGLFPIFPNPPGGCQGSASEFCRHFLEGRCTYGTLTRSGEMGGFQRNVYLDLFKVFFFLCARINHHIKPPFGEHVFIFSNHQTSKNKSLSTLYSWRMWLKHYHFGCKGWWILMNDHLAACKISIFIREYIFKKVHVSVPCWFTRGFLGFLNWVLVNWFVRYWKFQGWTWWDVMGLYQDCISFWSILFNGVETTSVSVSVEIHEKNWSQEKPATMSCALKNIQQASR